jgi:hypothetical protein
MKICIVLYVSWNNLFIVKRTTLSAYLESFVCLFFEILRYSIQSFQSCIYMVLIIAFLIDFVILGLC